MPTQSQLDANRANSRLSTGPKTEAGKTRAAQNARRHGLTSSHLVIADRDREEFDSLQSSLLDDIAPHGELEHVLFDTIVHAQWNIRRCRLLEAEMMIAGIDPMLLEQNEAKLRVFDRHSRRHESNFHRALKELRIIQSERAYRTLANAKPDRLAEAPSPLANTQQARQASLRHRAAENAIVGVQLDRTLQRLMVCPSVIPQAMSDTLR